MSKLLDLFKKPLVATIALLIIREILIPELETVSSSKKQKEQVDADPD